MPPPRAAFRVTMVGHASVLVQLAGVNVLIDPVWSERVSPVAWAGPRRVSAPGVRFEDLPPIDAVLVTHNHYDHMDAPTLRRLRAAHRPRVIAPLGNDRLIPGGAETADWGGVIDLGAVRITLVPAHHWSARAIGDRRRALWCGFVLQSPAGTLYNVGDTGYGDGRIFEAVRDFAPDVALIPIGAYEPRWFMRDQHVNPAEAVQIMRDCGARHALGTHWGVVQLTNEAREAPREALQALVPDAIFHAMEPGEEWVPPEPPPEPA